MLCHTHEESQQLQFFCFHIQYFQIQDTNISFYVIRLHVVVTRWSAKNHNYTNVK